MPDLAVSNDTRIISKIQKAPEILVIFKVHTYGEQTVVLTLPKGGGKLGGGKLGSGKMGGGKLGGGKLGGRKLGGGKLGGCVRHFRKEDTPSVTQERTRAHKSGPVSRLTPTAAGASCTLGIRG